MATVDATATGTAHGTLTPNTAEVINFGFTVRGQVEVLNRGTTVMYGQYGVTDLTIAGQGTEVIPPGGIVTFYGTSNVAGSICLKSTAAVDYSVSKFDLPREGGGGSGGAVSGTVELGATSLAALESITVVDGGGTLSVDDGAGSLTVDGTVTASQSGTWTVQPGNTANTTAWKVDGSAVTQPVSGTITADTELPAAAALSDTTANPTTPMVGAALMYWDGTQWLRWQRTTKNLTTASAPTLANVSASASSVSIFASNAAARQRIVTNDSASATLYLKLGTTASATSYTVAIPPGGYYAFETPCYTGACDGIWTAAVGAARTTEIA